MVILQQIISYVCHVLPFLEESSSTVYILILIKTVAEY
jgi:hypothetical protein